MAYVTPDQVRRKLNANADQLMRVVVLEAAKRIVNRTPVRTGRARNNWNIAEGSPNWSTTEDTANTALLRGAAVLANLKFGDTAFITNGLPYIGPLENGSSTQAPNGMVGLTVAELRPWIDAQVRKLQ